MRRSSRRVLLFAILTASVLVFSLPASAQQSTGLLQSAAKIASTNTGTSFLTEGMVAGNQPPPPPSQNQQGFGFGIKGGFLFTSATSAQEDFSSKGGTAIGIFFGGNRTGSVGVMGEILYAKKKFGGEDTDDDDLVKVTYLEIPILLRINIGDSSVNGLNIYGIAGPVFDIRLKAEQNDFDIKDNYEALDLGIIAGAGVEFLRFIAEARYNWGLRNIQNGNLATFDDIKTRTFMVLFGFRIN